MPNWCENRVTFMSNGTPEGELAIHDFHDRIINAGKVYNTDKYITCWECFIEDYSYDQSNGLFEYQDKLPASKRGYIDYISDVECGSFHIESYDAWAANNAYWVLLLRRLYGDLITFTYIASEPGMGCYYTNDEGVLPRYDISINTSGIESLMGIPGAFTTTDNLFMCLNRQNSYVDYRSFPYGYTDKYDRPNNYDFSFIFDTEGDDDECIADLENHVFCKGMPELKRVEDIKQYLPNVDVCIDEYQYIPLEDEVISELSKNMAIRKIFGQDISDKEKEETMKNLEKYCKLLGIEVTEF